MNQNDTTATERVSEPERSEGSLERVVRAQLREIESWIAKGKGTWPEKNYIRDEAWHRWQGEALALRSVLRQAGLDPDAP